MPLRRLGGFDPRALSLFRLVATRIAKPWAPTQVSRAGLPRADFEWQASSWGQAGLARSEQERLGLLRDSLTG